MNDETRRCLIADDHPAMAAAIGSLLEQYGFEVIGPASDGVRALALAAETFPDVALLDWRMPRIGGAELLVRLRETVPRTRILVYTAEADAGLVRDALGAGAAGVVLKEAPLTDLARALETVAQGRSYVDPALARVAIMPASSARTSLTAREIEVLCLLAEGLSQEEIGRRLSISAETVRTHVGKAAGRLGAQTRTQAVATALRSGLIA